MSVTTASPDGARVVDSPFHVQFEEITPERAAELLATTRPDNRTISNSRVARYADDLNDDFWETTHQGIAIDSSGRLMDGQHRLKAIVTTGTPAIVMVSYGVPEETFYLIDGGFARNAQSFLEGRYRVQRTALGRTLMRIEEMGGVADISKIGNAKYPAHRILNFLENRPDVRAYGEGFSKAAVAATKNDKFTSTSVVGLLVGGFISDNHTAWWEDVHALVNGDGVEEGNPLKALYRASPVGGNMTNVNYMRAIYTAVKYRNGEKIKTLRENAYRTVKVW